VVRHYTFCIVLGPSNQWFHRLLGHDDYKSAALHDTSQSTSFNACTGATARSIWLTKWPVLRVTEPWSRHFFASLISPRTVFICGSPFASLCATIYMRFIVAQEKSSSRWRLVTLRLRSNARAPQSIVSHHTFSCCQIELTSEDLLGSSSRAIRVIGA